MVVVPSTSGERECHRNRGMAVSSGGTGVVVLVCESDGVRKVRGCCCGI